MAIDFDDDLAEMLDADDHGVTVVHGTAGTTEGIVNKEFYEVPAGEVGIAGSEPALYVRTSWASGVSQGDALTVDGVSYTAANDPEDDGTGLSRIKLING